MSQPAQGTNGNGPQKFNWTRFIVTLIVIAGLVLLALWLFTDVFKSKPDVLSQNEFNSRIIAAAKDPKDDHFFKNIQTDISQQSIYVVENTPEGIHEYHVHTTSQYINDISAAPGIIDAQGDNSNILTTNVENALKGQGFTGSFIGTIPPKDKSRIWSILFSLLPILLIGLMYFFMMKRASSGGGGGILGGAGKSPAQKIISNKRFSDVAGQQEVKEEITEVIDFLKNPKKYKNAGARIPKGILLGGPPGTGKTLLAKATAGEAGVPFYFISASNFVEMFAGLGAKRVREMFKDARRNAPAILFIDELDAVGRKRGSSLSGNDEREQTLNQILVEMDGMEENTGLLIIAATNRPDVLDPALQRPGRFDRTITVNNPDIKEREAILKLHAKGKRVSPEIDFANIAKRTPSYSGAQLENIVNEATLLSVREDTGMITLPQIDEAIDRVVAGPAKKHRVITPGEMEMVAYHEAGHAIIGLKVAAAEQVQKITIIPRGDAGGYTLMTPKKETYNYKKSELLSKIVSYMGGRAAEQIIYGEGEVSTGAHNDIQKATNIARSMVTQFGMSILGPIAYEQAEGSQFLGQDRVQKDYSDSLAERIDEAIRDIVIKAEKQAIAVIKEHKKLLELIKEELLSKETIVLEEINYINENLKRPPERKKEKTKAKKVDLGDIISEVKGASKETKTEDKPKAETKKSETKTKDTVERLTDIGMDDDKKKS